MGTPGSMPERTPPHGKIGHGRTCPTLHLTPLCLLMTPRVANDLFVSDF